MGCQGWVVVVKGEIRWWDKRVECWDVNIQKKMPSARFELTISSLLVRCLTNLAIKASRFKIASSLWYQTYSTLSCRVCAGNGVLLKAKKYRPRTLSNNFVGSIWMRAGLNLGLTYPKLLSKKCEFMNKFSSSNLTVVLPKPNKSLITVPFQRFLKGLSGTDSTFCVFFTNLNIPIVCPKLFFFFFFLKKQIVLTGNRG